MAGSCTPLHYKDTTSSLPDLLDPPTPHCKPNRLALMPDMLALSHGCNRGKRCDV